MVTSFKTSEALYFEGDFPQPEFAPHQIWLGTRAVDGQPAKVVIVSTTKRMINYVVEGVQIIYNDQKKDVDFCYAATAADIMKHLPEFPQLTYNNDKDVFQCQGHEDKEDAEACAKAYLDRKRKEREADGKV